MRTHGSLPTRRSPAHSTGLGSSVGYGGGMIARFGLAAFLALLVLGASSFACRAAETAPALAFSFQEGGATFRVSVEEGPRASTAAGIEAWLRTAARTVAGLFGRFPVEDVEVGVLLRPYGSKAVLFGRAIRREGEQLELHLAASAKDDALPGEWVAIHEMIHLGFPRFEREDAWINEGFTTYYQEVLRGRAGIQDERTAWSMLADGFSRGSGAGSGRSLEEESRLMYRTHAFWRTYWGGAAMALDLDLLIRRATAGRHSLDDVVRLWWRRHGAERRTFRGRELLAEADVWLGKPLLLPMAERHLAAVEFADTAAMFKRIGIEAEGRHVAYLPEGPQMRERRRIMQPGGR